MGKSPVAALEPGLASLDFLAPSIYSDPRPGPQMYEAALEAWMTVPNCPHRSASEATILANMLSHKRRLAADPAEVRELSERVRATVPRKILQTWAVGWKRCSEKSVAADMRAWRLLRSPATVVTASAVCSPRSGTRRSGGGGGGSCRERMALKLLLWLVHKGRPGDHPPRGDHRIVCKQRRRIPSRSRARKFAARGADSLLAVPPAFDE